MPVNVTVAYQFAVLEMFETLQYVQREWDKRLMSEGAGRIDQINMDHVARALALAKPHLIAGLRVEPQPLPKGISK